MSDFVRRIPATAKTFAPRLRALDIELTERCDNDCIHCFINLPAGDLVARMRELDTEEVCDILGQAADLGCLQVRLTGGEPLLRPDFEDLYLHARRAGLSVRIFTNARRITPRLARVWAKVPPRAPIEVSVYGMSRGSYEAVTRTPGSHAQFRRGVGLLLEHGVAFVVKGALLPPNRGEFESFEEWARTIPSMDGPPDYSLFFELRGRRDDDGKNRLIRSVRVPPEDGVALLTRDDARFRAETTEFALRFMGPPGDRLFRCGSGCGVSVDAYGRAQPCMGLRAPSMTVDVRLSSLEEALNRFSSLADIRATNPEYLRRCARCFLHGLCEQCPARSWSEHGTLDTPVEYLCEVAHAKARHLGWLGREEKGWQAVNWQDKVRCSKRAAGGLRPHAGS